MGLGPLQLRVMCQLWNVVEALDRIEERKARNDENYRRLSGLRPHHAFTVTKLCERINEDGTVVSRPSLCTILKRLDTAGHVVKGLTPEGVLCFLPATTRQQYFAAYMREAVAHAQGVLSVEKPVVPLVRQVCVNLRTESSSQKLLALLEAHFRG